MPHHPTSAVPHTMCCRMGLGHVGFCPWKLEHSYSDISQGGLIHSPWMSLCLAHGKIHQAWPALASAGDYQPCGCTESHCISAGLWTPAGSGTGNYIFCNPFFCRLIMAKGMCGMVCVPASAWRCTFIFIISHRSFIIQPLHNFSV